jgi:hypothetical protein
VLRQLPVGSILERAVLPRSSDRFASATEMKQALASVLPALTTAPLRVTPRVVPPTNAQSFAQTQAPRTHAPATGPVAYGAETVARAPFAPPPTAPPPTAAGPSWPGPAYAPVPGTSAPYVGWNAAAAPPGGAPAPARGSGIGWILGGLGVLGCIVIVLAVLGGRAIGDAIGELGSGPKRSGTGAPTVPRPSTGGPIPTTPAAPPLNAERGVVVQCVGAANVQRPAINAAVTALGWAVTGESLLCIGDMINFRCKGPEGRGVTLDKAGQEGGVVVIKGFASPSAVETYVNEQRTEGPSLGVGNRAVLRVEMPPADAARVLDRLCK